MAERDPRQECGCPPWVVQCAHFEGQIVVLASPESQRQEAHRRKVKAPAVFHWLTFGPTVDRYYRPHPRKNGMGLVLPANPDFQEHRFDTEYAASVEFACRAELLRLQPEADPPTALGGGDG